MKDKNKTKKQVIKELVDLRKRIAELEKSETEHKLAEKELRKLEHEKAVVLDNTSEIIAYHDTDHNIQWANKAYLKATGLSLSKIKGKKCYHAWGLDRLCKNCPVTNAIKTGKQQEAELTPQNQEHWPSNQGSWLSRAAPVKDDTGSIIGAIEVAYDITKRKKAEERVNHINLVLQSIRNVNQLITKEKDLDELIKGACENLTETRGYSNAWISIFDEEGKLKSIAGKGLGRSFSSVRKILKEGKRLKCQKKALKRHDIIMLEESNRICKDCPLSSENKGRACLITRLEHGGNIYGTIIVSIPADLVVEEEEQHLFKELANDISYAIHNIGVKEERRQAEEELKRLNFELLNRNKELEQIVYVTSHDLRSPLVNVQGFSKELEHSLNELTLDIQNKEVPRDVKKEVESILEKEIPEDLQYIMSGISKMDSLLNGLLKLSRTGRAHIKIEKLNMNKLISKVISAFKFQLDEKGVKLEISKLPSCKGDAEQINQVFSNLLDNALKFLNSKYKGVISISGYREDNRSIYCVEDNGLGIAPEHQEKIFEIFHQLTPDMTPGEGLGLTIVRRILDRHKGKIWVESEEGKGSKFYVELPG